MTAASHRIHTFLVVNEPGKPDHIVIWDTQEISVGRSNENDLALDHSEVSRKHALFARTDSHFIVQNLNTSNGTLVNGEPIETRVLEPRDVIAIGEVEFTYFQSAKDPSALGLKVQYASQLKGFPGPAVAAAAADATMLGLIDTLPGNGGSSEDFEIRPAADFAYDLHGISESLDKAPAARDLDIELEGFGLDDLDIPDGAEAQTAAPTEAKPAARAAAKSAAPAEAKSAAPAEAQTAAPADARLEAWSLDDVAEEPDTLSLHLEIQGLQGELRSILRSLFGKVIELPSLKIRIKGDDLGSA